VPREWARKKREEFLRRKRTKRSDAKRDSTPLRLKNEILSFFEKRREKKTCSIHFTDDRKQTKNFSSLSLSLSPPYSTPLRASALLRWLGDEAVGAAAVASAPKRTSAPTKGRAAATTMPATPSVSY